SGHRRTRKRRKRDKRTAGARVIRYIERRLAMLGRAHGRRPSVSGGRCCCESWALEFSEAKRWRPLATKSWHGLVPGTIASERGRPEDRPCQSCATPSRSRRKLEQKRVVRDRRCSAQSSRPLPSNAQSGAAI